ncbi:hypothetical protein IAU59_001063 [Kwoniella sp. CBS 9459]
MRLNENTVIYGDRVILVPYRAEHVPTYHEWMKSPELLELTASEPLTYQEEMDMQKKWHLDEDKLTFILLARPETSSSSSSSSISNSDLSPSAAGLRILQPAELKQCRMVGDVNLFLPNGVEEDGECEIMIASIDDRRKGYAVEALSLFLSYLTKNLPLPPTHLIARISSTNIPSIKLFRKLGFGIVKHVKVFDEVEMRYGSENVNDLDLDVGLTKLDSSNFVKTVDWDKMPLDGSIGSYD